MYENSNGIGAHNLCEMEEALLNVCGPTEKVYFNYIYISLVIHF